MSNRKRDDIPQQPRKQVLLNATITFHAPTGDKTVVMDWNATTGDVTCNGALVHNTNDMGLLHTVAKGIMAAQGGKP